MRGLFVLLTGEGAQRLLSFVAIWLLSNRLAPADYAAVEVSLSAMMFAALFVELGFPLLAAREVARDPTAEQRLAPTVLRLQCGAAVLLVALAWLARAAGWLGPELGTLLPVYAASLLLLPWLVPWAFQGRGAMHWIAAPGVLRQGLFLLLTAALVRSSGDLARLPWLEVVAVGGAALLAQWAWRRGRIGGRSAIGPAPGATAMLREAAPMGVSQLLWALRMFLATLLLWHLVPKEAVGRYAVAHRVMMVLQAVLTMYFTNLFPGLSRAARGPRAILKPLLLRSTAIAVGGTLALALCVAANADGLLRLLFRPELCDAESASCLRLLVAVLPLLACRGHARMTLLAFGRSRLELVCSVAGTLALAALIPWWTRQSGVAGAAMALLVAEGFGLLLTLAAFAAAWRDRALPVRRVAGGA